MKINIEHTYLKIEDTSDFKYRWYLEEPYDGFQTGSVIAAMKYNSDDMIIYDEFNNIKEELIAMIK